MISRLYTLKKWTVYAVVIYLLLALQLIVLQQLPLFGTIIWLPPVIVGAYVSFEKDPFIPAIIGTFADVYLRSGLLFTILFPVAALLALRYWHGENRIVKAAVVSAACSLLGQVLFGVIMLWAPGHTDITSFAARMPLELVLSLMSLIFVYPVFKLVRGKHV